MFQLCNTNKPGGTAKAVTLVVACLMDILPPLMSEFQNNIFASE
jgi:hypothetical protein